MPNRLAQETSPYLLQHQDNPVDWYPWGDEAFAKARAEGKPIFLSVGYSSCHWCHVMEHESFEDEEVARVLNEHFVSVKVDREERPDVDEAYMVAVHLISGRGGWPMSAFLTPEGHPFFAGTYFPKDDRGQYIGFKGILRQIVEAWRTRRPEVEQQAGEVAKAIRQALTREAPGTFSRLDAEFMNDAVKAILSAFDAEHGGFGDAPKFPPHAGIEFLTLYAMQPWAPIELREASLGAAVFTLERMILGGIHDHVGGGFHRYATDARWLLPHFEKMLYDNALLLGNLARGAGIVHALDERLAERFIGAAQGIVDWLAREMRAPEGWFYSALDADSEGVEGKFYVWTTDEVRQVLGARAEAFMSAFGFEEEGNFLDEATHHRTGANIPHLSEAAEGFEEDLARLRTARESRVRPGLDDKALVSWNGLVIGALAEAGMGALAEPAAEAILALVREHGSLPHQIAKGRASGEAFLDDYAFLADGLLKLAAYEDLMAERGSPRRHGPEHWIAEAQMLATRMVDRFYDEQRGGFFAVSEDHEALFGRTKPVFDQPVPSGNAVALRVLVALGDEARARKTASAMMGWMQRAPQSTEALLSACLPLVEVVQAPAETEPAPAPVAAPGAVDVSLSARELAADSGGEARAVVRIVVPEGLHINSSAPPARWLVPTRVEVQPVMATVDYPPAEADQYVGTIEIPVTVALPPGKREAEFELKVTYQACTETECLAPQEKRFDCVIFQG